MATFMGFMMPRDGYGYGTIRIAERLRRRAGVEVVDMQLRGGRFGSPEERRWTAHGPVVALCTPDWLRAIRSPRLVTYTMFEATRLPEGWPEVINGYADGCLVPCRWCADVFRENGIRVPIGVVRWGVEPADYWPIERERGTFGPRNARNGTKDAKREGHEERPYTFLWSGTPDKRKGWDLVYRAFWRAFQ